MHITAKTWGMALVMAFSIAETNVSNAVPAHCSGNANGVLDITADGRLTYVQNTSNRLVHTKFRGINITLPIDLGPGQKEPIAVNGQGMPFTGCEANF
jgi:hypothetical protein